MHILPPVIEVSPSVGLGDKVTFNVILNDYPVSVYDSKETADWYADLLRVALGLKELNQ